jgi:putative Mg2+ transporter-C (MgtC) family protein
MKEAFGGVTSIPLETIVIRLCLATLIGALIGWDRQRQDKPAGLRTHMLVTLGSATFVLLGFEIGATLDHRYGQGIDPTRVLQGVVGGIGFLGAGSIIKGGGQVSGVTTAAGIWVSGALGAAMGMGAYVVAGIATVLTLFTLILVASVERKLGSREGGSAPSREAPVEQVEEKGPPPGTEG